MKKVLIISCAIFLCTISNAQSYLGTVIKNVNMRVEAGKEFEILKTLPAGAQVFINSLDTINGFYSVIDIASNTEGYIYYSFIHVGEPVQENSQDVFVPSGSSSTYQPEIEIFNNTSINLTLKLNSSVYSFAPYERRTLIIPSGECNYRASAPGVIPYIGKEQLEGNTRYSWTFFISTHRR